MSSLSPNKNTNIQLSFSYASYVQPVGKATTSRLVLPSVQKVTVSLTPNAQGLPTISDQSAFFDQSSGIAIVTFPTYITGSYLIAAVAYDTSGSPQFHQEKTFNFTASQNSVALTLVPVSPGPSQTLAQGQQVVSSLPVISSKSWLVPADNLSSPSYHVVLSAPTGVQVFIQDSDGYPENIDPAARDFIVTLRSFVDSYLTLFNPTNTSQTIQFQIVSTGTPNQNIVTFNANGGTGTMSSQTIATGASAPLASNSFSHSGYTFAGWNTQSNGGGTSYANGASYTMGSSSVTLYAQWTPNAGSLQIALQLSANQDLSFTPTTAMISLGNSVTFTPSFATGTDWQWWVNGSVVSTASVLSFIPASTGFYTITVAVQSGGVFYSGSVNATVTN